MTETEAVQLDSIEEIDEDPPPDELPGTNPPPELGELAPEPTPEQIGHVDVEPSELEMGTVDPTRGPPKPPPMGVVTPPPPTPPLGFKEPWVSFDTTPEPAPEEPPDLEAIKKYFADLRDKLVLQVAEIETQLGFIAEAADLAVRVAKLERFLGIKG